MAIEDICSYMNYSDILSYLTCDILTFAEEMVITENYFERFAVDISTSN
jgi:hypothetical protein